MWGWGGLIVPVTLYYTASATSTARHVSQGPRLQCWGAREPCCTKINAYLQPGVCTGHAHVLSGTLQELWSAALTAPPTHTQCPSKVLQCPESPGQQPQAKRVGEGTLGRELLWAGLSEKDVPGHPRTVYLCVTYWGCTNE